MGPYVTTETSRGLVARFRERARPSAGGLGDFESHRRGGSVQTRRREIESRGSGGGTDSEMGMRVGE